MREGAELLSCRERTDGELDTKEGQIMKDNIKRLLERYGRWFPDTSGTIITAFAIMAPIVVGTVGLSLDISEAYLVRQRLAGALDASALAGAASSTDEAEITDRVEDFFEANYPDEKIGVPHDLNVEVDEDYVTVSAEADYNTSFMSVLGIDSLTVGAQTVVQRKIQGLEVVMVLDNTGSMSTNDNIGTLRTAATNFTNILFDKTNDPEFIKIGLVPYANAVRVGKYGLGQNPDGSQYGDGTVFVTKPTDVSYTTSHSSSTGWYGCVVEHHPDYNSAATYVAGSYGQLWMNGTNWDGHGWDPTSSSNDPTPQDTTDDYTGPWDIYMKGSVRGTKTTCSTRRGVTTCTTSKSTSSSTAPFDFSKSSSPNDGCPYANILPMTSDQAEILASIDSMDAHGMTRSDVGMIWGRRVVSPEAPFTEGAAWNSPYWRKAVVIMTDGDNTDDSTYSANWDSRKNNLDTTDYNERFLATCNALKDENVLVYSIVFTSGVDATTKQYYQDCATSSAQYFDAPTQTELIDVFEQISNELATLHISS